MKMWSGRVSSPLDPDFEQWQRSLSFDRRLIAMECMASAVYARALAKAGVLSDAESEQIVGALDEIARSSAANYPAAFEQSDAEDIHHFVEQQLVSKIGDVGLKLHAGRSRNEQIATDLRLFTRQAIARIRFSLGGLCAALVARARDLGTSAMPAYTHLQRAEPVLAAHWLLAYVEMFLRDAERLADCRSRVDILPLGSGAVAGCTIPLDRDAMAREMGFGRVSANSMDATSDRDFEIEFLNALSLIALHLSRLAEDFVLYSTIEFGFVRLPDSYATGSSAMPQKKNPDAMELLRGKAGRVIAAAQAVILTMKGLPMAYDRDLQETQGPLFSAADAIADSLQIATGFTKAVEFDRERMQAAASSGHLNATAAANYLVRKGVPFRRAHEIVGKTVRHAIEKKCELESLPLEELRQFSPEFGPDFSQALALSQVIAEHDVVGGTAPRRVQQAMNEAEQKIAALQEKTHARA